MIDRTTKPTPNGKINFQLPQINKFRLKNLIDIYHVEKSTLPIVQFNIVIEAGSIYDNADKIGAANLTSMLIDEGAGEFSGLEISNKIETLGSIMNISTSKEITNLSLLSLKENLSKSLDVISLVIRSPRFTDEDFLRQSNKLKAQILQLNDDPSYLASKEFNNILFSNSPYENPSHGTLDSISNLNNDDVKKFHQSNYLNNQIKIIVVGDISKEEVLKLGEKYFGNLPQVATSTNLIKLNPQGSKKIILVNKNDAAQSEIRVGHLSKGRKSEDFYSRSILNSILGGQFSSRINLNLREDKGYTYGAHSSYNYIKPCSSFLVSSSVKTDNTIDSLKEIYFELDNARSTLTEEELIFSKSFMIRRYPSLFETYSQIATNLSLLPNFNLPEDYFNNYTENIDKVSLDELHIAAKENLLIDQLTTVVVGNRDKIEKELKQFAEATNSEFETRN